MAQLKIGWSEVDITPNKKVSLAGQFAERISQYVEKPLTVTAMAVECGGDQMVIVGCDMPSIPHKLMVGIRELLKDNKQGLDPMKVLVSAIHTHTGYATGGGQRTSENAGPMLAWRNLLLSSLKPGQKYVEKENVTENPDILSTAEAFELVSTSVAKAGLHCR